MIGVKKQGPVTGFIAVVVLLSAIMAGYGESPKGRFVGDAAKVVGTWTGESICVNKEKFPACNDERVVYRLAQSASAADVVTITMDKIVDGKAEMMAELDFKYDAEKGTLVNEFTRNTVRGVWAFTVKGNSMEGTLTVLPDKTLVRRIKLKKGA